MQNSGTNFVFTRKLGRVQYEIPFEMTEVDLSVDTQLRAIITGMWQLTLQMSTCLSLLGWIFITGSRAMQRKVGKLCSSRWGLIQNNAVLPTMRLTQWKRVQTLIQVIYFLLTKQFLQMISLRSLINFLIH